MFYKNNKILGGISEKDHLVTWYPGVSGSVIRGYHSGASRHFEHHDAVRNLFDRGTIADQVTEISK